VDKGKDENKVVENYLRVLDAILEPSEREVIKSVLSGFVHEIKVKSQLLLDSVCILESKLNSGKVDNTTRLHVVDLIQRLVEIYIMDKNRAHPVPGPTGSYPRGKLRDDDAGELKFSIGVEEDKIILRFGTPIRWIGFDIDTAKAMIKVLIENVIQAESYCVRRLEG
jgi:hypothetical protein